jgi:Tol biopolymer transport system component
MKDDAGSVQLWTIPATGGEPRRVTHYGRDVASAFSWSPDGRLIAHVMDNSVCVTEVATCNTRRLTLRTPDAIAPRPEACVYSPDGRRIAYVRRVPIGGTEYNQVFVLRMDD